MAWAVLEFFQAPELIIDPVTTGPVSEAQIDGIRGDSALSGADPARFGHDVLGKLDAVRRAFGG